MRYLIAVATVFTLLAVTAQAQKPVTQGGAVTESFVIDAINRSARLVTLRGEDGLTETISATRSGALRRAEGRGQGHLPLLRVGGLPDSQARTAAPRDPPKDRRWSAPLTQFTVAQSHSR